MTMLDEEFLIDRPEAIPELAARLLRLREQYVTATPRQRLAKARERIRNAFAYPNQLVTHVSAIEGVARSLLMHQNANSQDKLKSSYKKYKNREAHTLVTDYFKAKGITDPESFVGSQQWKQFRHAVDYRNLLVHECTYLGLEKFDLLINGCETVLNKLAEVADLRTDAN